MKLRPNDQAKIFSPFITSGYLTIDPIIIKWPHNAERIDNASWLRSDEKPLVPFVGRTIRASHFNQMADSVMGIQHYLKDNYLKTYVIKDGLATLCGESSTTSDSLTGVSSTKIFDSDDTLIAYTEVNRTGVSISSSTSSAISVSGFVTIPAVFGSNPYSNISFNAVADVEIVGSSDLGWYESQTKQAALAKMNTAFSCLVGTCPGSSNTTLKYVVTMPKFTAFSAAASSTVVSGFPWTITKNYGNNDFNTDSTSPLRTLVKTGSEPSAYFWYNATSGSTGTAGPITGSITNNMTPMPSSLNLLEFKGAGYFTNPRGGLIYHKDLANNFALDVGIEFTWHSWELYSYWMQNYPHFHIAGPCLRVCRETTTKTVSSYTSGTQYTGYAVKFFAAPNNTTKSLSDFNDAPGSYKKDILMAGSVAIIKFRYDDFALENNLLTRVYQNFTVNSHLLANGGWWGTIVTGTNSEGYHVSSTHPAEYKILASTSTNYVSGTGYYDPVLQLDSDNSHWYWTGYHKWKFEMVGDTLSLYRTTDNINWVLVLSYTDPDPIEPVGTSSSSTVNYIPSAFYNKTFSGIELGESEMVFSNINSYLVTEPDSSESPDSTIDLRIKIFMSMMNDSNSAFPTTSI